ncbi:MAG: 3-dehydroquinate synthase, partial [Chitinophagaceae bacterium]
VGGGVITDLTGYIASVYMRGIRFGFVPTTLLAMVDASVGGKNGVDLGVYKNMVGLVKQPAFIVYMPKLLRSLPEVEWRNGFAEIIKHAAIADAAMFRMLAANRLRSYRSNAHQLNELIVKNALLKARIVQKDPFEHGVRRLLNFGHTVGHALENQYALSHGEAISIGMTCAALVSYHVAAFRDPEKLIALLDRYGLPTYAKFDADKVMNVLKMDKKRERAAVHYVVLERIGKAATLPVSLTALSHYLKSFQA